MKILKINKTEIPFPEYWDELTAKQILSIVLLYGQFLDYNLMRLILFSKLSGLTILKQAEAINEVDQDQNGYWFEYKNQTFKISAIDIAWLLDKVNFIFASFESDNAITYYIQPELTVNRFPELKSNSAVLYGPADKLANVSWLEWQTGMIHYTNYKKYKEINSLKKLVYTLYRPKRVDITGENPLIYEDKREKFSDWAVDARYEKLKISTSQMLAVLFYFEGCLRWIEVYYSAVFGGGKVTSTSTIGESLDSVICALAENDPAQFDTYREKNLHDILKGLVKNIENKKS